MGLYVLLEVWEWVQNKASWMLKKILRATKTMEEACLD